MIVFWHCFILFYFIYFIKRLCIYVNISMAALGTRWRHAPSHAPIRVYDTHSFSGMAAAGEDFIDLCLGRLLIFGCDVSFVSGRFLSVADKVCPRCSQPWRRWIRGEAWLQKLVLELWRDAASKLHQQLYVQMRKHISAYLLSIQTTRAVSTHELRQKMKDMQPSPCLLCVVFVAL